jgi:hypothetical protein
LGTMKSRVARARIQLHEMLNGEVHLPSLQVEQPDGRKGSRTTLACQEEEIRRRDINPLRWRAA